MALSKPTRADYGIDAPPQVRNLAIAGIACALAGLSLKLLLTATQPTISFVSLVCGLAAAFCLLFTAGLMVWSSKKGKLIFRERLLDSVFLRGDETIVDIGCGRGLLLNAAARRLPRGKAIGIDLWQSQDQSGNRPEVTLANARAEGVAHRVEIKTADMRKLPLPDGTADVVVSNIAIHNIPDKQGRSEAVKEIARILKAGGQVALADLRAVDEYAQTLKELGWRGVSVSGLNFAIFPPVRIVRGKKPL
jgi:SAM-dependent methyltransferase